MQDNSTFVVSKVFYFQFLATSYRVSEAFHNCFEVYQEASVFEVVYVPDYKSVPVGHTQDLCNWDDHIFHVFGQAFSYTFRCSWKTIKKQLIILFLLLFSFQPHFIMFKIRQLIEVKKNCLEQDIYNFCEVVWFGQIIEEIEIRLFLKLMTNKIAQLAVNTVSNLASRLRELQLQNRELEDSINLQIDFLNIHTHVPTTNAPSFSQSLIEKIKQQQALVHQQHSKRLLASQIRVQKKREMDQLIKSYEGRIVELYTMLVNKQIEIAEAAQEEGRDTLPRRENLRKLNIQVIQKNSINKALQELKKLNVQNDALEHCLKQNLAKNNIKNNSKKAKCKTIDVTSPQPKDQSFKQKIISMNRDKLLMKIYELLHVQVAKQGNLKTQWNNLKQEWVKISETHRQLVKNYKKQGLDCAFVKNKQRQHYCQDGARGLNFLQQLQRAEKQINRDKLFHRVDLNIEKQKGKIERKQGLSRERGKTSKQN